jgi:hypothetical protein
MSRIIDPTAVPGTKPPKTGPSLKGKVRANPPAPEGTRLVKGRGWVA